MNRTLKYTLRAIRSNWQILFVKVFTLGIGIALSTVLFTKIIAEWSKDSFYLDIDQLHTIEAKYTFKSNRSGISTLYQGYISGGVANRIAQEVSGIAFGTRFYALPSEYMMTADKKEFKCISIVADDSFFDVLHRPILQGDPQKALSTANCVMISKTMAKKLGSKSVVGETLLLDVNERTLLTIGGVYEDFPFNSTIQPDLVISLKSLSNLNAYDGADDWVGNDRYTGIVKLHPNVNLANINEAIKTVQSKYQDQEYLEKGGIQIKYLLKPLAKNYTDKKWVKQGILLLSAVSVIIILIAILNYALLSTSTVILRSREVALHKCMGAGKVDIILMVYTEAFIHIVLALIFALILMILSKDVIFLLTDLPIEAFVNNNTCSLLFLILFFLFIATGIIPAYLYLKIPVLTVLNNYNKSNRMSKLVFLFIQIIGASLLLTFLLYINKQYYAMLNEDVGYSYDNILFTTMRLDDKGQYENIVAALKECELVEDVSSAARLPFESGSGNNFRAIGNDEELLNIADMYGASTNYLDFMGMKIVEGKKFELDTPLNEILVSDNLAKGLAPFVDLSHGIVGQQFFLSEHGIVTIRGVYRRIRLGTVLASDSRPSVIFNTSTPSKMLLVKLKKMNGAHIAKVNDLLKQYTQTNRYVFKPYVTQIEEMYKEAHQLQKIILIGSVMAFLIVVIGLIGYTQYEVKSRSKEIAIRKINGATFTDLTKLFSKHIYFIALPAILLGMASSIYLFDIWAQDFTLKASLTLLEYIYILLFILLLISLITIIQLKGISNSNPIDSLKSE